LKKAIRIVHLWVGLAAGTVLFVVAVTGTLLVFRDELEPLIYHRELFVPGVQEQRLSMDELIRIARQRLPHDSITKIRLFDRPDRTVLFRMENNHPGSPRMLISIDPYTGRMLKVRHYDRWFFESVEQIHRYLLLGPRGKIITGISCASLLIMLLSGLVLWWPAGRNAVRQRFRVKLSASRKRRNWDLHAVIGFYAAPLLIITVVTGLTMSYKWVGEIMDLVGDGHVSSVKTAVYGEDHGRSKGGVYDRMILTTRNVFPAHGDMTILPPYGTRKEVAIYQEEGNASTHGILNLIQFDPGTGATLAIKPFEEKSAGGKIHALVTSIHTGRIYGWPTKVAALLLSLVTASLPVTGFCLWRGKKRPRKALPVRRPHIRSMPDCSRVS